MYVNKKTPKEPPHIYIYIIIIGSQTYTYISVNTVLALAGSEPVVTPAWTSTRFGDSVA